MPFTPVRSIDEMLQDLNEEEALDLNDTLDFGKYQGKTLSQVIYETKDISYLSYLEKKEIRIFTKEVMEIILNYEDRRATENEKSRREFEAQEDDLPF